MRRTEIDQHRLMYHPCRVSDWLEGRAIYPLYVEIGPTNRCNHRCAFCALDWLKHGGSDVAADVLVRALDDMGRGGVKSVMFAGEGEPLLHPAIGRFVQRARQAGMDVAMTTNGALLDQDLARQCLPGLSWIRVSLDAGTPKTYAEIHGVGAKEFKKVLANIENAVRIRNEQRLAVTVGVQVLMLPMNLGELPDIAKRVKAMGADNVQFKPYSHHPDSRNHFAVDFSTLDDTERQVRALADETFQVLFRRDTIGRIDGPRSYGECLGLPFFALIDSAGNVIPCNLFYNRPEFTYGNLNESTFSQLWQGERRRQVLAKIRDRGLAGCRAGCRLDAANRYLWELKNPHPHVNFI